MHVQADGVLLTYVAFLRLGQRLQHQLCGLFEQLQKALPPGPDGHALPLVIISSSMPGDQRR